VGSRPRAMNRRELSVPPLATVPGYLSWYVAEQVLKIFDLQQQRVQKP